MNKSIIAQMSEISGKVTIGNGCYINPGSSIIAEGGEIVIGEYNIIEERVVIHNKPIKDSSGNVIPQKMVIGNYNVFEISSKIDSSNIGNYNVFEKRTLVDNGCEIQNYCRFGACSKIPSKSKIEDYTRVHQPFNKIKDETFEADYHKENIVQLYEALASLHLKASKAQKK